MNTQLQSVLDFWFEELSESEWFNGGEEVDATITKRFVDLHPRIAAGEFWKERVQAKACLAEVIVLDQFSRNMFRDDPRSFAFDGQALTISQQAIATGLNEELSNQEKMFLYMPFMHSESPVIHEAGRPLFESLGIEETIKYAKIHKDIIDRFGRYPHRNEDLGRPSTPEEIEYLANNHESFF
jgi:uncharacterized protein (DUF924 family)